MDEEWFAQLEAIPGVGYRCPLGVERQKLPGYNAKPTVRKFPGEGRTLTSVMWELPDGMLALGGLTIDVPRGPELTKKLWGRLAQDAQMAGDKAKAEFLEACGALDAFFHERHPAVHRSALGRTQVLGSLSTSEQAEFTSLLSAMQEAETRLQAGDSGGSGPVVP